MQADLTAAMKARDSSQVAVLRATLGALANAEAVAAPSGPVSLTAAAGTTEVARRELTDDADHLRDQAVALDAYL